MSFLPLTHIKNKLKSSKTIPFQAKILILIVTNGTSLIIILSIIMTSTKIQQMLMILQAVKQIISTKLARMMANLHKTFFES